jgi:transketolase
MHEAPSGGALPGLPPSGREMANALRFLSVDAIEAARSGHPGMPLGMADVATVLVCRHMRFSPHDPRWPARDRLVLSAGHGSMLLYSLFYLLGYEDTPLEALKTFRQKGSPCAGHPERGLLQGVEVTTGPLAQGLAHAVGIALAERLAVEQKGSHRAHYTFVICSDGCLMEGLSHEAASLAGHQQLGRLVVLFDDNRITIDGSTDLSTRDDTLARFQSYGWHVQAVDGHDGEAVDRALQEAKADDRPSLVACRTVIGWGSPGKQGTAAVHGSPLGASEIQAMREALGWPWPPFDVPAPLLAAWRSTGAEKHKDYQTWQAVHSAGHTEPDPDAGIIRRALGKLAEDFQARPVPRATRVASHAVLEVLQPLCPHWIGGAADLTPSVNTRTAPVQTIRPPAFGGHYIHYGVREHAMAAVMNGLGLEGEFRAFGGTFLAFSDYMRPAMRMAALMGVPSVFVLTHDSVGLGEDGPTHQPVEHLWSLRLIPGLEVWRPADAVEVAECWAVIAGCHGPVEHPVALVLSRQDVPLLRHAGGPAGNPCVRGGYVVQDTSRPGAVLLATGSEVALAADAADLLQAQGVPVRVVSMPCVSRFLAQEESYRQSVLPPGVPVFALEAGCRWGWVPFTGALERVFGIDTFGLSAPGAEVLSHFGLEPGAVATRILAHLQIQRGA